MEVQRKSLVIALSAALFGAMLSVPVQGAVQINASGNGEVLLVPYYTVQDGRQTVLSVSNTTGEVKIIRVRIREAKNNRPVLGFNLFLGPFDEWVASIQESPGGAGGGNLQTNDTSCTVQNVMASGTSGVDFVSLDYSGDRGDNGGEQISRTREGYIEIFEMGVIDESDTAHAGDVLAAAAKPATRDCSLLQDAYFSGPLNTFTGAGMWNSLSGGDTSNAVTEPEGGLRGNWTIIDTSRATQIDGVAVALEHFFDPEGPNALSTTDLHFRPGDLNPDLNDGDQGFGRYLARFFDLNTNQFREAEYFRSADAVSAALMHHGIINAFSVLPNTATDWVVTFPTKNFYVDNIAPDTFGLVPPFTSSTFAGNGGGGPGMACETTDGQFFSLTGTPGANWVMDLCWAANVLSFGSPSSDVLGSTLVQSTVPVNPNLLEGQAHLDLATYNAGGGSGTRMLESDIGPQIFLLGLPVIGFAAFANPSGTSAIEHKYTESLVFADGFESGDTSIWANTVP